jgi:hypothetical protein
MFQTKVVEEIKTHILCLITFFRKSCRLWDNAEKYSSSGQITDNIIRRMRFACWITTATDTHLEYVILFVFPRHQWLSKCALKLPYTYIACLVPTKFHFFCHLNTCSPPPSLKQFSGSATALYALCDQQNSLLHINCLRIKERPPDLVPTANKTVRWLHSSPKVILRRLASFQSHRYLFGTRLQQVTLTNSKCQTLLWLYPVNSNLVLSYPATRLWNFYEFKSVIRVGDQWSPFDKDTFLPRLATGYFARWCVLPSVKRPDFLMFSAERGSGRVIV